MSCMNAFVHDLDHCTKLQLSTRCSFGVMTQTRHINFNKKKELRNQICAPMNCIKYECLCNNTL